jgi:hypothetical protein
MSFVDQSNEGLTAGIPNSSGERGRESAKAKYSAVQVSVNVVVVMVICVVSVSCWMPVLRRK